jgi:hypothetical protein
MMAGRGTFRTSNIVAVQRGGCKPAGRVSLRAVLVSHAVVLRAVGDLLECFAAVGDPGKERGIRYSVAGDSGCVHGGGVLGAGVFGGYD